MRLSGTKMLTVIYQTPKTRTADVNINVLYAYYTEVNSLYVSRVNVRSILGVLAGIVNPWGLLSHLRF